MAIVVGVAVLVRRGWRPALAHTAPLIGLYLVWLVTVARHDYGRLNVSMGIWPRPHRPFTSSTG